MTNVFVRLLFSNPLDVENWCIYRGNRCVGFDDTFGYLVDTAGCPRISSKRKWNDFMLSIQRVRMPQIGPVHIIYPTYAIFVSLGQIRSYCLLDFRLLTYFIVRLRLGLYWVIFRTVIFIGFHTRC